MKHSLSIKLLLNFILIIQNLLGYYYEGGGGSHSFTIQMPMDFNSRDNFRHRRINPFRYRDYYRNYDQYDYEPEKTNYELIQEGDFSKASINDVNDYLIDHKKSINEILSDHSKWRYQAYIEYLRTLDEYEDYVCDLNKKFESHKERKKSENRYVKGFQKRGFVEKIQDETNRLQKIKDYQAQKIIEESNEIQKYDPELAALYKEIALISTKTWGRSARTSRLGAKIVQSIVDEKDEKIALHVEEYRNDVKEIHNLLFHKDEVGNVQLSIESQQIFGNEFPNLNIRQDDFIDRKIVNVINDTARLGCQINPLNNFEASIFKDLSTTSIYSPNSLVKQAMQFNNKDKIEDSYYLLSLASNLKNLASAIIRATHGLCVGYPHSLARNAELIFDISRVLFKGSCYVILHPIETLDTIAIADCLQAIPGFYEKLPKGSYEQKIADRVLSAKEKVSNFFHDIFESLKDSFNKFEKYAPAFAIYEMYENEPPGIIEKINDEKIKATQKLVNRLSQIDPYDAGYFIGNFKGDNLSFKLINKGLSKAGKSLKKLASAAQETEQAIAMTAEGIAIEVATPSESFLKNEIQAATETSAAGNLATQANSSHTTPGNSSVTSKPNTQVTVITQSTFNPLLITSERVAAIKKDINALEAFMEAAINSNKTETFVEKATSLITRNVNFEKTLVEEVIEKFGNKMPKINWNHEIMPEFDLINNKIKGYHWRGSISDIPLNIIKSPNKFGIFEAEFKCINPNTNKIMKKFSTFFPDHWDTKMLSQKINEAYNNPIIITKANGFIGETIEGISIQFWFDKLYDTNEIILNSIYAVKP